MLPYLVILFFLISFSLLGMFKLNNKLEYKLSFISFLILFLFSGLRYGVGMDYESYFNLYESSLELNEEIQEIGFRYLFYFLRQISFPFECVILFFSYVTIKLVFLFVRKNSPFFLFSILIFFSVGQFYFNTFNAIRQTLALYLFLGVGLNLIVEKKALLYVCCIVFVSFCVHLSALFLLPLYVLVRRRIFWGYRIIFLFIISSATGFLVFLVQNSPYSVYLNIERNATEVSLSVYLLLIIAIVLAICEYFLMKETKREIVLFGINYISIVTLLLVFVFSNTPLVIVFLRLTYFFTPIQLVLIPIVVNRFFSDRSKLIVVLLLSSFYGFLCFTSIKSNGDSYKLVPYKTIFSVS